MWWCMVALKMAADMRRGVMRTFILRARKKVSIAEK